MNCETFTAALFDEAPRPPGFEAHRDSCRACREALAGHQAATALQGAPVFLPTRVRGRAVATRVAVVAGLLLVAGVGLRAATRPPAVQAPPQAARRAPLVEGQMVAASPQALDDEQRAWLEVWRARDAVALDVRRDVSVVDPAYAPFRSLPLWLAPTPVLSSADDTLTPSLED